MASLMIYVEPAEANVLHGNARGESHYTGDAAAAHQLVGVWDAEPPSNSDRGGHRALAGVKMQMTSMKHSLA